LTKAFVTPLSKSHVDETSISFAGLYNGKLTPNISVKRQIEESDAVIHIGPLLSDSNTGGWSQNLRPSNLISLGHDRIQVRDRAWSYIHFAPILKKLVSRIQLSGIRLSQRSPQLPKSKPGHKNQLLGPLEQHHFWKQFSFFVKPGDCIIAEVGSAQYGTLEIDLPHDTTFFTQLYYSSIGFTVGALLGALLARREQGKKGRVILFIGDGSLHMTVQVRHPPSS
jgi:pyruvate decarboxylase